jgi:glycosyltransferase involved in cell wall biosynthesis
MEKGQKRPDRFIRLASELPTLNFVLIGPPGPDEEYNMELRQSASKLENLEFKGFVSPDEISEYYRRAITLANTSNYEGFPNTFLESWRHGTPVCSLYFDLDGRLESDDIGTVSGDLDTLKQNIRNISNEKQLWEKLSQNARSTVENEFDLTTIVDKLEEEIQTISPKNQ